MPATRISRGSRPFSTPDPAESDLISRTYGRVWFTPGHSVQVEQPDPLAAGTLFAFVQTAEAPEKTSLV